MKIFSFAVLILASISFVFVSPIMADNNTKYVSNQESLYKSQNISPSGLAATELKLLGKAYPSDPMSKRLQRLELLTFGSTQYGNTNERWNNIQSFLQNKNSSAKRSTGGNNSLSSNLNDLEKYVFKKN